MRGFIKNWYGKSAVVWNCERIQRPTGIRYIILLIFCHTLDIHFNNTYGVCIICGNVEESISKRPIATLRRRFNKKKRKPIYRIYKMIRWCIQLGKCPICHTKMPFAYPRLMGSHEFTFPTFDHVTALSKGGYNTLNNMQIICANCNHSKAKGEDSKHGIKKGDKRFVDFQNKKYRITLADLIKENTLDNYRPTVYTKKQMKNDDTIGNELVGD